MKKLLQFAAVVLVVTPAFARQAAPPLAAPTADMRIVIGVHLHENSPLVVTRYIDASSKPAGDYTREITVERGPAGRAPMKLYVTAEGLALMEKYGNEDKLGNPKISYAVDGTPLQDWWSGIVEEGKGRLN